MSEPKLPSYASVMQQQQQQQQPPPELPREPEPDSESHRQPSFRQSYEGLHQRQQQQTAERAATASTNPAPVKDGTLEVNVAFLQSPAGGLLAASSILGLVIGICGAVPLWSHMAGGAFCVFTGLLHFAGGSFLFFAYLYNFLNVMPWYSRALAIYYYVICAGVSLVAFVYAASGGSLFPAAIASAIFAFLALAVDIVLIVLSYMALKLGYSAVQYGQEPADA